MNAGPRQFFTGTAVGSSAWALAVSIALFGKHETTARQPPGVVRATCFELVGADGKVRAILSYDQEGDATILRFGASGAEHLRLVGSANEASLSLGGLGGRSARLGVYGTTAQLRLETPGTEGTMSIASVVAAPMLAELFGSNGGSTAGVRSQPGSATVSATCGANLARMRSLEALVQMGTSFGDKPASSLFSAPESTGLKLEFDNSLLMLSVPGTRDAADLIVSPGGLSGYDYLAPPKPAGSAR